MEKLFKVLGWIDKNILKILVVGFIFLIPLLPKLPIRMINYTYVAFRFEDIYVFLVALIFIIQFIRRKVRVPTKFAVMFLVFWSVVFISFLWGYFVQGTITVSHLGFLHSLRRIEYMLIFFVVYATISSKKDLFFYLKMIFAVLTIVCVYGFGQKFLGWPAVQTMNPEYAKGYILVLDAYARISSSFAGHYDLAAYLIFLIPIVLGAYMYRNKKIYLLLFLLSLATLILTASRASYLSYLGSVTIFLLFLRKFKLLLFVVLATVALTPISSTLTSRLSRTFQETKVYVDSDTGFITVPKDMRPDDLPPGDYGSKFLPGVVIPTNTPVDAKTQRLAREQIRDKIIYDASMSGQTLTEDQILALVEKTFGRNIPVTKYLLDISLSTRFQVEWPRAIAAFKKNPILGTGPSSLGEATDGDYFRWIGEMGLLGTLAFIAIIIEIVRTIYSRFGKVTKNTKFLFYGFLFGTFGLMINALYIDVFEASKVAYTYWLVAGIFTASIPFFVKENHTAESLKMSS